MPNLIGQSLGRYHILEQLGEGGMATVYKAYDTRLETDVAVKAIRTEALPQNAVERALKRFEREAKALARLTHPNIVKVTDYGEFEGKPYLVMEYLPSGTLKSKLHGKPMAWQEAARLLIPVACALDFAHRQGMIHRDVKPSNILITADGEPMLTDFGIAKMLDLEETVDLTGTSAAVGTPEYMAPEQATSKTVDGRADIYSLGVVFYEMVVGRKPFTADTPMAVIVKQASEPLPRPRTFVPDLPQAVENVLLKMLAKKPEDRYQNMDEFAVALGHLLTGKLAVENRMEVQPKMINKQTQSVQRVGIALPLTITIGIIVVGIIFIGLLFALSSIFRTPMQSSAQLPSATQTITIATSTIIPSTFTSLPPILTSTASLTSIPSLLPQIYDPHPMTDDYHDSSGVPMRSVPAGQFLMGSNAASNGSVGFSYPDEQPAHTVDLDSYYIDKYEVTNALYEACVTAGVCDPPRNTGSNTRPSYYGNSEFDNYPVIYMSWNQAKTYCEWRHAELPTEAQWEKAARGANGPDLGENPIDCSQSQDFRCKPDTAIVGSYGNANGPYGAYDMVGNVWTWVSDWYSSQYYSVSPASNPQGPSSGKFRALRGGFYLFANPSLVWWYGVTLRSGTIRSYIYDYEIGIRCARSAP